MNKVVYANNIPNDTSEDKIIGQFSMFGNVASIEFICYYFMNQIIRLNTVFISFCEQKGADEVLSSKNPPVEIRGKLISILPASSFVDQSPTAILLGDSLFITKEIIHKQFQKFDPIELGIIYSGDTPYYIITFESKQKRDDAVDQNQCFVIFRNTYSLRIFGAYPQQKLTTVHGISKIIDGPVDPADENLITLKHFKRVYKINPIISAAASVRIRKELFSDPTMKKFKIFPLKGDFTPIYDVLWGKQIKISEKDYDPLFLYMMAAFLEIESLMDFLEDDYYNGLTTENAISGIRMLIKFGCGLSPNIRYIASHAKAFIDNEALLSLPNEFLQAIVSSEFFCGSKEVIDKMWEIVSKGQGHPSNPAMMQSLQNLTRDEYIEYISDHSLDLNTIRYKFIELLESDARKDPTPAQESNQ